MKNLLLVLAFLFSFGLHAQEEIIVPATQMPVITKIAATWCPPCGTWGWDFFEYLLEDNSDKAVIFAAHHSGDLINEVASALTTNYDATSQPRFFLDGTDQGVNSGNGDEKRQLIQEYVEEKSLEAPIVQTGIEAWWIEGETNFRVRYKTKFFQNTSGDYYAGFYLVEKTVIANQASIGADAVHKNIIREELTGNYFGTLFASDDIAAGEETEGELAIPFGDYAPENLEIIAIIWKKVDNKYYVINANKDSDVSSAILWTTKFNEAIEASFKVTPSLIQSTAKINFSLPTPIKNANISLLDIQGKEVAVLHQGVLPKGENSLIFNRTKNLTTGVYFIRLTAEGKVLSRKVIIK